MPQIFFFALLLPNYYYPQYFLSSRFLKIAYLNFEDCNYSIWETFIILFTIVLLKTVNVLRDKFFKSNFLIEYKIYD